MTTDEWLAAVAADRPPLTAAQIALLRPVLAPVVPHMQNAPPACEQETRPETTPERNTA